MAISKDVPKPSRGFEQTNPATNPADGNEIIPTNTQRLIEVPPPCSSFCLGRSSLGDSRGPQGPCLCAVHCTDSFQLDNSLPGIHSAVPSPWALQPHCLTLAIQGRNTGHSSSPSLGPWECGFEWLEIILRGKKSIPRLKWMCKRGYHLRVPSELQLGRMSRVSAEDQPSENCLDRRRNTTDTCKRS